MLVPSAGPLSVLAAGFVLVLLGVAALVLAAGTSRPARRRPARPRPARRRPARLLAPRLLAPQRLASRRADAAIAAEMTLLRQLATAEITRREYREQIEQLAARGAR